MAIGFAHVRFETLCRDSGAVRIIAYLARETMHDPHFERDFEFPRAPDDLVYSQLFLPDDAPILDLHELAVSMDAAELRRMRRWVNRERWPQLCAQVIVALPPDTELSLDECAELISRVIALIQSELNVAVYVAIHDPALQQPGARNRHAHLIVTLREITELGFATEKLRGLFASLRATRRPNTQREFVTEAINWPVLMRDLQQSYFCEIGSDVVVDPSAPAPAIHWSKRSQRNEPQRRAAHDRLVELENLRLIKGSPAELVASMLRGRATLRIAEIERLLARFLDSAADRERQLERILADQELLTFARTEEDPCPSYITTRAAHDLIVRVIEAADHLSAIHRLSVVSGSSRSHVMKGIREALKTVDPSAATFVIGQALSHTQIVQDASLNGHVETTIAGFLKDIEGGDHNDDRPRSLPPKSTIIIPRTERVSDLELARLLLHAAKQAATVILGYDSTPAGHTHALAAHLADRFSTRVSTSPEEAAQDLRAGLARTALTFTDQYGSIRFGEANVEDREGAEFVVCDDSRRLIALNVALQDRRVEAQAHAPVTFLTAQGELEIARGQKIAFTRTDYSVRPPFLREGRLASLEDIQDRRLVVRLEPDWTEAEVDLDKFAYIRSAFAVTTREARFVARESRLLIETTNPKHIWSTLLLAAHRPDTSTAYVAPHVARDLLSLIEVTARSMPAVLPSALFAKRDPRSDFLEAVLAAQNDPPLSAAENDLEFIELMPMPRSGVSNNIVAVDRQIPTKRFDLNGEPENLQIPRHRLSEDVRAIMTKDVHCRASVERLITLSRLPRPLRSDILRRLKPLIYKDSVLETLIGVLTRDRIRQTNDLSEMDLPEALASEAPRSWTARDLEIFRIDLVTMGLRNSNWRVAFESTPLEVPERRRRANLPNYRA